MDRTDCHPPPAVLTLPPETVHVWFMDLDRFSLISRTVAGLLSVDERKRAEHFRLPRYRHRYVLCRGLLRLVLGGYLGRPPEQVAFEYGVRGKPCLSPRAGSAEIKFNLSHSGNALLLCLCRGRDLGVDIEVINEDFPGKEIVGRFFSREEYRQLDAFPPSLQTTAFFHGWVRKEAFLKGCGSGLTRRLDSFTVSMDPDEPGSAIRTEYPPHPDWSLISLRPDSRFAAALALQGGYPPKTILCWRCTEWWALNMLQFRACRVRPSVGHTPLANPDFRIGEERHEPAK